jgi:hypothetical protein
MPAVEGSLDDPPIVLRQDRLKLSLMFLALAAVTGLLLLPPWGPNSTGRLVALGFLGLCSTISGLMTVRPTLLILEPDGLTLRLMWRTFEYPWSAFTRFYVLSRPRRSTVVVGEFTHEGPPKPAWRRRLIGRLELGSFWELPPQRVTDVLNEARSRWALPAR